MEQKESPFPIFFSFSMTMPKSFPSPFDTNRRINNSSPCFETFPPFPPLLFLFILSASLRIACSLSVHRHSLIGPVGVASSVLVSQSPSLVPRVKCSFWRLRVTWAQRIPRFPRILHASFCAAGKQREETKGRSMGTLRWVRVGVWTCAGREMIRGIDKW